MNISKLVHDPSTKPLVMGIVNVTPDSFSDGGIFINKNKAIEHGLKLLEEGADILDIGGESTRPGSQIVNVEDEIERVIPVIQSLSNQVPYLSIDTRNAKTMALAIKYGANIINDVSALEHDTDSMDVARDTQATVILMHMQGTPKTMQLNPVYKDVVSEVYDYLKRRVEDCLSAGISRDRLIVDPGIGFGKTLEHNLLIQRNISKFFDLGVPVLVGTSRKKFIAELCDGAEAKDRLGGSLSSIIWARSQGVRLFRVHDVKQTVQALKIYDEISSMSAS